jgi:fucose 4-O-acetylase-like acetyltransferase
MKTEITQKQDSLEWILIAKGIGIFLVVVGHFYPETSPDYWTQIKKVIYSFHMPLFFILSGYLYTHDKYP